MRIPRTLAIVLAGGAGSRMSSLTDTRAKPSLRMGGAYRLIDVALSNLVHSRLNDVWIVEEYLPHTLNEHLAAGRPWDLDRINGGLRVLAPFTGAEGEGFAEGNSDSLWRHKDRIAAFDPDIVIVLSADHLYTLNLLDVIETHRSAEADLTLVTTRHDGDGSRHGVVAVEDGTVTDFWYKPDEPPTDIVVTEIFCFDGPALLDALTTLHERDGGLADYGDDLVPHFVGERRTVEHRLVGYWRDIGTLDSYWLAHMDLLDGTGATLDDPDWPILSAQPQLPPARIVAGADVADSLVAAGACVAGVVRRSVVGPGAVVEEGAVLDECIVLDGARVRSGVRLVRCIVDESANVAADAGDARGITLIDANGEVADVAEITD